MWNTGWTTLSNVVGSAESPRFILPEKLQESQPSVIQFSTWTGFWKGFLTPPYADAYFPVWCHGSFCCSLNQFLVNSFAFWIHMVSFDLTTLICFIIVLIEEINCLLEVHIAHVGLNWLLALSSHHFCFRKIQDWEATFLSHTQLDCTNWCRYCISALLEYLIGDQAVGGTQWKIWIMYPYAWSSISGLLWIGNNSAVWYIIFWGTMQFSYVFQNKVDKILSFHCLLAQSEACSELPASGLNLLLPEMVLSHCCRPWKTQCILFFVPL